MRLEAKRHAAFGYCKKVLKAVSPLRSATAIQAGREFGGQISNFGVGFS